MQKQLEVLTLSQVEYQNAADIQQQLVWERIEDNIPDRLLIVNHPPVITIGKRGSLRDLCYPEEFLRKKGIGVCFSDRGGKATFHGPGQFIAYPIIKLPIEDSQWFVSSLLLVLTDLISEYGLSPELKENSPGVWVNDAKIASIGIAVKKWVTYHGIALNVSTDLSYFDFLIPCGMPGQKMTSMEKELKKSVDPIDLSERFIKHFKKVFGYHYIKPNSHPKWLKRPLSQCSEIKKVDSMIKNLRLETVCQSAKCPNLAECFGKGTATFMILGEFCTRQCHFCAVKKGSPAPPDPDEPSRIADAVKSLGLKYAVITSVTRDDLADAGASQFIETIKCIRQKCPAAKVEILVPDFRGKPECLEKLCLEKPDMFNHNIETVPRLYPIIRPAASYQRSLNVLSIAAKNNLPVKSGIMLGLGESTQEIKVTLNDLKNAGCEFLTISQYLAPSKSHAPIARYVDPEEFKDWADLAKNMGFKKVASGPLVRSSYMAEEFFIHRNPDI